MKLHLALGVFVTLLCLLSSSSGKRDKEGVKRRPDNWRKIVNNAIKKASEFEKRIKNVIRSVKNLDKKSKQLDIFSEYSQVMEKVIDNYPDCAAEAQGAYSILQNCKTTVPALCSPPNVSIKKAEECVDEKTSSFVRFLRCTSRNGDSYKCYVDNKPKISKKCKAIAKLSDYVTKRKDACLDYNIIGSYGSCLAVIKNDVPTILNDCFGSSGTSSEPVESKTVFVEGDEVVEQTESFNTETNELTISVPAHGDRVANTVIIGEDSVVTSYDQYCVLTNEHEDFVKPATSRSSDATNFVETGDVETVYTFNIVEDDINDTEKDELSDSFKNLCGNKPIKKSSKVVVDEDTFNDLGVFDPATLDPSNRILQATSRQRGVEVNNNNKDEAYFCLNT